MKEDQSHALIQEIASQKQKIAGREQAESERKLAEEALRESEERFRLLIRSLSDMIFVIDGNGQVIYESPSVSRCLGYDPGYFIGKSPLDFIHPDDVDQAAKDIEEVFSSLNDGLPSIFRCLKADNTWVYLETLGSNHLDQPGIQGVVVTARDITERKRAEMALRESEQRWQFALEGAGDGVWDWNAQTNEVFFSHPWKAMLGYADDEIGNTLDEWDRRIHPEDRKRCYDDLNEHFTGKTPVYINEHRLLCKDGDYKWILDRGKVIEWTPEGKPLRVIGTHTDISERKRIESALKKSEAEKTVILESVSDMIFYINRDMRVVYSNPAMDKFFNLPSGSLGGKVCYEALHHRDKPCSVCPALRAMQSGKPQESYVSSLGKHWRLSGFPVRDENGLITGTIEAVSDITDLRNAEEKYRVIFDNAVEGIYQSTPDGRLISANPALAGIFGYDSPEIMMSEVTSVGRNLYADPDRRQVFLSLVEEQGVAKNFEFEGLKRDGERIYISTTARAIKDGKGNTIHYEGIVQDVTERRRAEESLKISEQKFRELVELLPQIVFETDIHGNLIFVNRKGFEMFNYPSDNRAEKISALDMIAPRDRTLAAERAAWIMSGKKGTGTEMTAMRKDGELFPVIVYAGAVLKEGQVVGMRGTVIEITERKRAEEALRESEERFRALSENAPDIIYTMNLEGAVTYANPSWKRILGHDKEELLGRYFTDFVREEDRKAYRKLFKTIRDNGKSVDNYMGVMLTKDGKERMFNMNTAFNRDSEGRMSSVLGTMTDITEQREMEKKLQQAQKLEAIGTLA
ncbi:MAG: hypothetical protein C0394_08920, partial [Syntrophus sp. (in: bacteria)]|nr:hypothetical protein [Syntrophus sp. (in: bacteria)]